MNGPNEERNTTIPARQPRREQNLLVELMASVDAAFEQGLFQIGEELDAILEHCLDDLDHRLSELDEGGDVIDGDNQPGIEDQFIAAWSQVLAGLGSFAPPAPEADLAAYLRAILIDETFGGPYAPSHFLDVASDEDLIRLAADLWNERQALILGTR
jgi:hypothetical protein